MKQCNNCGVPKELDEFYTHPQTADKRQGDCKECQKFLVKKNYRKNIKKRIQYEKERQQRPERKAKMLEYQRKTRADNPEKYKATNAVNNALRDGRLTRQPCACWAKGQAHHEDYSKPLEVTWLCRKCHLPKHGKEAYGSDLDRT